MFIVLVGPPNPMDTVQNKLPNYAAKRKVMGSIPDEVIE
jgi:hypothetical protein